MKGLFFLVPALFVTQSFAADLECSNSVVKVGPRNSVVSVVDRAAEVHTYYGSPLIDKTGKVFGLYRIQNCVSDNRDFQGVAIHFKVRAKAPRSAAKVYTCLSKQKRYRIENTRWGQWVHVATSCGPSKLHFNEDYGDSSSGSSEGSSSSSPAAFSPDDVYDPMFYQRSPSYGPEGMEDGEDRVPGEYGGRGYSEPIPGDEWH